MYIPTQTTHASGRAKELAARLRHTIADYTRAHPKMTSAEIEAALAAAKPTNKHNESAEWKAGAIVTAVGVAIALMLGLLVSNSQRGISPLLPVLGIAIVGLVAGAFWFVKWRDR